MRISRSLLARYSRGGFNHTLKQVERLALLEQASQQSAGVRAEKAHSHLPPTEAAFLRTSVERVEAARKEALSCVNPAQLVSSCLSASIEEGGAESVSVTSFSEFLTECKRHRIYFGEATEPAERLRRRETFRSFWRRHAESAVLCCSLRGRDFGFMAQHGLADTALTLPLSALRVALDALVAEKAVSSGMDVTRSLQYIARELARLEQTERAYHSRKRSYRKDDAYSGVSGTNELTEEMVSPTQLSSFRRTLADMAIERLVFFFITNGHVQKATTNDEVAESVGAPPGHIVVSSGASIATAEDALSALEVLSHVRVADASPAVVSELNVRIQEFEAYQSAHKQHKATYSTTSGALPRTAMAVCAGDHTPHGRLTDAYLVTHLFLFALSQRRGMNFTAVVHAFSLLRVFLPTLWPPYNRVDGNHGRAPTPYTRLQGASHQRPKLLEERDGLFRITWGLAIILRSRDSRFTNPYHFVKIMTTLARLPAFALAPPVSLKFKHASRQKQEIRQLSIRSVNHFTLGDDNDTSGEYNDIKGAINTAIKPKHHLTAEDFWRYIVSKACIFVPNLAVHHRRIVCRCLHISVKEKRGDVLGHTTNTTMPSPGIQASLWQDGRAMVDLGGTADDLLLPLVAEMKEYDEDYYTALKLASSFADAPHHTVQHRARKNKKRNTDGVNRDKFHGGVAGNLG